jgi:Immunity protein 53
MDDLLQALQEWFARHCDGEREHNHGISIETCDNPGWWVKIDLVGTELLSRPFSPVAENIDPGGFPEGEDWLHCYIQAGVWHGAGDERKLAAILGKFLKWASTDPG